MNDYIEGKKYVIHRFSEDREICVVKKERLLYIYENEYLFGTQSDNIWLSDLYEDITVILQKDGEDGYCYALMKRTTGHSVLIEIASKKFLLELDKYDDFLWSWNRRIETKDYPDRWSYYYDPLSEARERCLFSDRYSVEDALLVFLNKRKKTCFVISLRKGFLFGLYHYKSIKEYENGFIVDDEYAIDRTGKVINLSFLNRKGNVFYNKDILRFYYFDDCYPNILHWMPVEFKDEEYLYCAYYRKGDELYIFDTRTNEIEKRIDSPCIDEGEYDNGSGSWSYEELRDAADIAYGGFSPLELGLD